MTAIIPKQGHLYIVALEPRVGTKPGKQRPSLAIQPNEFAESGLGSTVIIPVTTKLTLESYPLRIRLPRGICGLKEDSELMIDQVLAWDNRLFRQDLGSLPELIQRRIKEALKEFLDLT